MPAPPCSSRASITIISRRDLPSSSAAMARSGVKSLSTIFSPGLTPNVIGYFHDQPQFRFFIFNRQRISAGRAGEAALRRDSEILDRHELRGLVDSPLHRILVFQHGGLRADQSEAHELVFGHQAQRREIPGPRRIVLKEEAVHFELVE